MSRGMILAYGVVAYLIFLGSLLYAIGFVGGVGVPKTIDSGAAGGVGIAIVIDLALLSFFAVQHSVMARPAFRAARDYAQNDQMLYLGIATFLDALFVSRKPSTGCCESLTSCP